MNSRFFKLIFSRRFNALVAVGENCSSEGKSTSASLSSSLITDFSDKNINLFARFAGLLALGFMWVASAFADPDINALPVGGSVAQGSASISQQANQMVINQATDKAIINWQGFNIGAAASINVLQPNASSVLLNRVVGNDQSQIFGSLTANGHVILVNPNGIVFGVDGSVTASAFTASTLGISDADFMAGNYHFVGNGANGSILNQGSINATAGYVALLSANVTNDGKITTNQGNVYMGAAQSITVPVSNSGRIRMELDPASVNAAVNNTQNGVIVTSGGQVLMQASAVNDAIATARISHAGQINTTATQAGNVTLLTDRGNIRVSGSVVANSTTPAHQGGDIIIGRDLLTGALANSTDVSGAALISNKGFVETSGDWLKTNNITIIAQDWLLDPTDISIVGAGTAAADTAFSTASGTTTFQDAAGISTSEVLKSTIESAINNGTNVTISTTNTTSGANGSGNITIATALSFNNTGPQNATLSLQAKNGITQNSGASITAIGSKLVNVVMLAEGKYQGVDANSTGSNGIILNSSITTNGTVEITGTNRNTNAGNGIQFANGSGINATSYSVKGISLKNSGIYFSPGTSSFTSSSAVVDSFIEATSAVGGGDAIFAYSGATVNIASGAGKTTLATSAASATGIRLGFAGGSVLNTSGDVTIGGKSNNSSYLMNQGTINALSGNLTLKGQSTGNGVFLQDGGGVSARVIGTNGANITIDGTSTSSGVGVHLNVNGSANTISTTGISSVGSGGSISIIGVSATSTGITQGNTTITNSTGAISINGTSQGSSGLGFSNGGGAISANQDLTITGSSVGNNAVYSAGAFSSTTGSISVTGTSSTSSALSMQGAIAARNNVVLSGTNTASSNTNAVVFLNKAITATTGTIDITAATSGNVMQALQLASGASLNTTNNRIGLTTDSISIDTTVGSGATINAGTNTVAIQNKSTGVQINLGGNDVGSASNSSRTLGISNSELNRITAGNLDIGSSSAGNITVSSVTTTLAQTGHVSLQTGGNIAVDAALTVGDASGTKNLTLNGAGPSSAVSQTAAIKATGLELKGATATHTLTNTLNSITTIAANTGALSLVNSINLIVGTVNTAGITTTGNLSLLSNNGVTVASNITSNGNNISITANGAGSTSKGFEQSLGTINAGAGDITIVGTTKTSSGWPNRIGANIRGTLIGNNIQITGTSDTASAIDGMAVQFQGGANVTASGTLTVQGEVKGGGTGRAVVIGNGMSTPTVLNGASGINITGTLSSINVGSPDNAGIFIEASGVTAISSNGAINLTGDSAASGVGYNKNAVFLKYGINLSAQNGTTIEGKSLGNGASVYLDPEANINVTTGSLSIQAGINSASNDFITSGVAALITQNSNASVSIVTKGQGSIVAPKIINNGAGDVVLAAGSVIAAGTGAGGQVLTVNGNNITQNSSGKTYIYTGQTSGTGVLSYLDSSFNSLYYQGTSQTLNAAFNQAYSSTITGGANAQVIFREATLPNFSLALPAVTLAKTYGAADPVISDVRAALQTAYSSASGAATLSTSVAGVAGNNTFSFSAAEAINSLSGNRVVGNDASTTPYAYTLTSSLNTTITGTQPSLRIDKAGLVAVIDNITTTYGTVKSLTAQFSGFAYTDTAASVGISLAGLTTAGYTGNTTTSNVLNGGYAITVDPSVNQNSTTNYFISGITDGRLTINPATISVIANNASKLVTRSDPALTYSYSGLVNGDASSVLSAPTLTRQAGQSAGQYTITAAGASAGNNYTVQHTSGVFRIAGVQELLIQMDNISSIYGASIAPSVQSVEYIDNSSVIFTLSRVANTNTWTDGVGGSITITPTLNGVSATNNVGIYQNAVTNTNNGTATSSGNFIGVTTQSANVTISPKPASINISNVNRNYDGSAFTSAQASASTSDLVNGDTITSLGGLSYNGSAIGSVAAGTYTIGANLTNPSAASNYLMTINNGRLTTRAVPAKEDKPFVNPVTPKPVTPTESGSKSQVSLSTTAQSVDLKLAAIEKPSLAEQCSATTGRSEKCDCQKTLFEDVMLCKLPLEGSGQPAHATKKAKAHSNPN
jgi:filamentous hemagglutinin family protein